ncbi:flagellar export chaperone FliS [Heyndrickxia ginsengihumi]|uniref:flagellar export chaperone FliS n=1 Tax=Heyndrickxia ginsengihumi TaxID=363870 RepID=UPI0020419F8E|nr:flagellar export chaperone FliS [Heyndrickxia ginsengihumi]MCM3024051.1 flagellar export chaperone FliS [Heyndrickxia ginsengihumi]
MTMRNPYQAYQQNSVTTASPGELTLQLYNGCLKFMHIAKNAIEKNDIQQRHANLIKAQNIISELMTTLDEKYDVAQNMMLLYDFILRRLMDANLKNDLKALAEAEELVTEFRDTWKEVIQLNRQQSANQGDRA